MRTDAMEETTRGLLGKYPRRRQEDEKYETRCLRLNNNEMTSLTGFNDLLTSLLAQPDALRWLDLSFNKLPNIDPVCSLLHTLSKLLTQPSHSLLTLRWSKPWKPFSPNLYWEHSWTERHYASYMAHMCAAIRQVYVGEMLTKYCHYSLGGVNYNFIAIKKKLSCGRTDNLHVFFGFPE